MKKLLSIWSGRLLSLLFPAALVVSFLAPANALAIKELGVGGDGQGGGEGDPLDTNDYGSGGGSGGDVHNNDASSGTLDHWGLDLGRTQVFLVPQIVGGTIIFRVIIVDRDDSDMTALSLGGTHAQ